MLSLGRVVLTRLLVSVLILRSRRLLLLIVGMTRRLLVLRLRLLLLFIRWVGMRRMVLRVRSRWCLLLGWVGGPRRIFLVFRRVKVFCWSRRSILSILLRVIWGRRVLMTRRLMIMVWGTSLFCLILSLLLRLICRKFMILLIILSGTPRKKIIHRLLLIMILLRCWMLLQVLRGVARRKKFVRRIFARLLTIRVLRWGIVILMRRLILRLWWVILVIRMCGRLRRVTLLRSRIWDIVARRRRSRVTFLSSWKRTNKKKRECTTSNEIHCVTSGYKSATCEIPTHGK